MIGLLFLFVPFMSAQNSATEKERAMFKQKFLEINKSLPMKVMDDVWLVSVKVDGDYIVYDWEMTEEQWKSRSIPQDITTSDKNVAKYIGTLSPDIVQQLLYCRLGIAVSYKEKDTKKDLLSFSIEPQRLTKIKEGLDNGTIVPYTVLELLEQSVSKYKCPLQIDEGIWMTNVYVQGKNLYYEVEVDETIDFKDIPEKAKQDIKATFVSGVKDSGIFIAYKKELIKENVHFIYLFRDSNKKEVLVINIGPEDLI